MIIREALLTDKTILEKICLETSTDILATKKDREIFTFKWVINYLQNYPRYCFVSVEGDDILGYIVSTPDTEKQEERYKEQSNRKIKYSREVLGHILLDYPAHLHINLTSKARGKGVGSMLIKYMENNLISNGVTGVHLGVMSDKESAIGFYKKNGFKVLKKQILDSDMGSVLFMGKILA